MDLDAIPDAAKLAAQAPAGGILPPKDDRLGLVRLDLWADRTAVAKSKLIAIGKAFGPRLQIQDNFQLIIHSGELAPAEAAKIVTEAAFCREPGPLISVLRGEDVLDQLEGLIAAGCQLEDHSGKRSIASEPRSIARAWAAAPRALHESMLDGDSRVIITRNADEQTLGGGPEKVPDRTLVSVQLIDCYELCAAARHGGMLKDLPPDLTEAITFSNHSETGVVHVTGRALRYDQLADIAGRLELAAGTGAFDRPLVEQIAPRFIGSWIQAPRDLIEFGVETRPTLDWADGS